MTSVVLLYLQAKLCSHIVNKLFRYCSKSPSCLILNKDIHGINLQINFYILWTVHFFYPGVSSVLLEPESMFVLLLCSARAAHLLKQHGASDKIRNLRSARKHVKCFVIGMNQAFSHYRWIHRTLVIFDNVHTIKNYKIYAPRKAII